MTINYVQTPIQFFGYNTDKKFGAFLLGAIPNEKRFDFSGSHLITRNIHTNYNNPSMLDFYNCNVHVKIKLGFPEKYKAGEKSTKFYLVGSKNDIEFSLNNIYLEDSQNKIVINSFEELKPNEFIGNWKITN